MKLFDSDFVRNLEYDAKHFKEAFEDERAYNKSLFQDIETLEKEYQKLEGLIQISGGLKCPNCNDEGFTPEQDGFGNWYQQQCQFCWEMADSVFNRRNPDDRD